MGEGNKGNQERNIMIMFLSNVHYERPEKKEEKQENPRKIFNDNKEKKDTTYKIYGTEAENCIETNEAPLCDTLTYLKNNPIDEVEHRFLDAVFYFVSNRVKNCDNVGNPKPKFDIYVKKEDTEPKWKGIASDEEFFWTERAEKLTGLSFKKAVSIKDIVSVPPDVIWRIPVAFNDDPEAEPVKSSIDAVRAMEEAIREYLAHEEVPWGKCNIYADTTGGFRPANMAMSAVMQLLVYQGATLRRAVYSELTAKKVSDVQPINDMYHLVAGVNAFTKFGSSTALSEYFEDVKDSDFQNLLNTMNAFSESVLLCQEKLFEDNLQKLIEQLGVFSQNAEEKPNKSAKVKLFARMVPNLVKIYTDLLAKDERGELIKDSQKHYKTDRIKIIRWCVKNKLLQPAVTFCTEWLPEYLINHGVVYVTDKGIQKALMQKDENDPVGKEYFLRNFLTSDGIKIDLIHTKSHRNVIKRLIDNMELSDYDNDPTLKGFVREFKKFLRSIEDELPLIKDGKATDNERLKAVYDELVQPSNGQKGMNPKKVKKVHVLLKLQEWASNDLDKWYRGKVFGLPKDIYARENENFVTDDQSGNAAKRAREMFRAKLLETDLTEQDEKDAIYYIEEYTYIRARLRNKINHADAGGNKSSISDKVKMEINDIANYLMGYLDNLELLKDKPRPHFTGRWNENKTWARKKATS